MKTLLVGINAKYIHPNLAIRLLRENTSYNVDIIEYTIKEDIDSITSYIISNNYEIVGFSCYIWNIEMIKIIISKLRKANNNIIIILGGPEVSYNGNDYLDIANYVIKNEGESTFNLLLDYLHNKIEINKIPNLYYKNGFTYDSYVDIKEIKTAYSSINDVKNQIVYFETSRGCPFHCSYCMASLDNKVRYFDMDKIKADLLDLLNRGARVIKFLDRTFNSNKNKFKELVKFLVDNHRPYNSFQFEITGDLLDYDVIEYVHSISPKNLFRFEIGIQSTNILSNKLVYRIQNNEKLFNNIKYIQNKGIIDLHLDLIAGLPKEDYNSFKNTFNEVLELRPKELQLGFLKLLHGTKLECEKDLYGYKFNDVAPYEIIENESLSTTDIANIHIVEDAFEKYYNYGYMNSSIRFILDNVDNPFDFFFSLGNYYINHDHTGLHNLFKVLDDFLLENNYPFYDEAHISLLYDYLAYNNCKPRIWWEKPDNKNDLIRYIDSIKLTPFTINMLYKYCFITEYKNTIIAVLYIDNKAHIYKCKRED